MVRLDRIYTRGGDAGMTSLGDGHRVKKTHPRIAAYGAVDELNAVLGVVIGQAGLSAREKQLLLRVQNDLFDVGADLCVPRTEGEAPGARLRVDPEQVRVLEAAIDGYTAQLEPLRSFILPGGTAAASWLHVARVVCRRAELGVAALADGDPALAGDSTLVYLNRLSDLLFVMARWTNRRGRADVLWQPGAGRAGAASESARPARRPSSSRRAKPVAKKPASRKRRRGS